MLPNIPLQLGDHVMSICLALIAGLPLVMIDMGARSMLWPSREKVAEDLLALDSGLRFRPRGRAIQHDGRTKCLAALVKQGAACRLLQGSDAEPEAELFGVSHPAPGEPFLLEEDIEAIASLRKLYLVGPGGSGKSVALATLAHWARTSGWLVRGYLPLMILIYPLNDLWLSSVRQVSLCTPSACFLQIGWAFFGHLDASLAAEAPRADGRAISSNVDSISCLIIARQFEHGEILGRSHLPLRRSTWSLVAAIEPHEDLLGLGQLCSLSAHICSIY